MADEDKADPTDESTDPANGQRDRLSGTAEPIDGEIVDEIDTPAPGGERADAEPDSGEPDGESRELVGVGAERPARERAGRRSGASALGGTELRTREGQADGKKGRATARRRPGAPERTRTGPVTFVRESVGELRKVVYPTGQQLINYFFVVLVFVLFVIAFVSLLDLTFGAAIFKVFS